MGNRLSIAGALLVALALSFPVPGLAQGDIATGTITGTVMDAEGAALPGVTVTVVNPATGFSRNFETDVQGRFELRLLPSGTYNVRANLDGYAPFEQQGITVRIGEVRTLRVELGLETITEEIIVTSEAPVLETTKASLSASISEEELESLPLNGRDFIDLVALTPQAVEVDSDRISVNGQRGIMNSFNIDGADSNSSFFGEERGGTRPAFTYSQAAIKEFQVVRSSYSARFGNASGGIVNAVTKTGTNTIHGEVFYYNQSDSFIEDEDALGNEISTFERDQGGFNLGGPIQRDVLHYFVAYDGQRRDDGFPRQPDFQDELDADPALNAAWEAQLTALGIDPETEFDYVSTNDQDVFLARLDWAVADNHQLWLRSNWSDNKGENLTDTTFQTTGRSANGFEENSFVSTVASLNSVMGSSAFNELIVQYSAEERPRSANVTGIPEINIGFFDAVIGQNQFLPNFLDEDKLQIQNNYSRFIGEKHTLKAGIDYTNVEFDDGFCRFCSGAYSTIFLDDFVEGDISFLTDFTQAFSDSDGIVSYDTDFLALYVADEFRASDDLTLQFGLRYESQDNPTPKESNPLQPLTAQIPDFDDIAPRFGFSWAIGDNALLRGGGGIFFAPTPSLLVANALLTNGVTVTRVVLSPGEPGYPTFPGIISDPSALGTVTPDIFVFQPGYDNPETLRFSLGYERALTTDFTVGIDGVYSESENLERKKDINLDPTPTGFTSDGRPIYGGRTARLDPNFNKIMQFTDDAEAEYWSLALTARKRFSDDWQFQGSYTYAESKDHDTNERSVSSSSSGWPSDHFDLEQDWGWSDYDTRHRVVLSGTWVSDFGLNVSGIYRYRDALPINPFSDSDLNNDQFDRDRPGPDEGFSSFLSRNSFRGDDFQTLDVRLSYNFDIGDRFEIQLLAEAFNLLNSDNFVVFENEIFADGERNPDFGEPLAAAQPRSYQLGARIRF